MLLNLISDPGQFIAFITALLVAITIHEFSHAWIANALGDPTAKREGRLTMNPIAHLDLMGTIFMLLVGFGWGKPVPINVNNLKNPKIDEIKISLAGPFSNLILATILGLIIRFIPLSETTVNFLVIITIINLVLMTFNLLPIPPLDGSHLLKIFISQEAYLAFERLGIFILLVVVVMSNFFPVIQTTISFVVNLFFNLVVGQTIQY